MRSILYLTTFLIFAIAHASIDTIYQYILFSACIGNTAIYGLSVDKKLSSPSLLSSPVSVSLAFYMPVLIFLSWVYGVLLGIINNVPLADVFRNFAGLVLYLFFYMLWIFRPSFGAILQVICFAALIQMTYGALFALQLSISDIALFALTSVSDLRTYYSPGLLICYPLITIWLFARDQYRKRMVPIPAMLQKVQGNVFFFLALCCVVIVPPMSKGFILSFLFLLAIYSPYLFGSLHKIAGVISLGCLAFILAAVLLMVPAEFLDLIQFSFTVEERGNAIRYEQYQELIADMCFWGKGLGSALSSGYRRKDTAYGFELTYLNLIHKLGFFALPLFASYIFTAGTALKRLYFRRNGKLNSAFAFGCMLYLIPGAFNPILLAPHLVLLHCLAMYVLFILDKSPAHPRRVCDANRAKAMVL